MAGTNRKKLQNAFVYQGYVSPEYFCDKCAGVMNMCVLIYVHNHFLLKFY